MISPAQTRSSVVVAIAWPPSSFMSVNQRKVRVITKVFFLFFIFYLNFLFIRVCFCSFYSFCLFVIVSIHDIIDGTFDRTTQQEGTLHSHLLVHLSLYPMKETLTLRYSYFISFSFSLKKKLEQNSLIFISVIINKKNNSYS